MSDRVEPSDGARLGLVQELAQALADADYLFELVRTSCDGELARVRQRANERATQRSNEVRETFIQRLDELRNSVSNGVKTEGLCLAPWDDEAWSSLPVAATGSAERPLRLGTLKLTPPVGMEDVLSVPATLALADVGVILIETPLEAMKQVREGLLGWCCRVAANLAPGAASLLWLDDSSDGGADRIPTTWRRHGSLSAYLHHFVASRAGDASPSQAESFAVSGSRIIVVAFRRGSYEDQEFADLLEDHARRGMDIGIHVILVTSNEVESVADGVLHIRGKQDRRRVHFTSLGDNLGEHEIVFQEGPPEAVMELAAARLADAPEPPDPSARPDPVSLPPPLTRNAHAQAQQNTPAAHRSEAGDVEPDAREPLILRDRPAEQAATLIDHVRAHLGHPPTQRPTLFLGLDQDGVTAVVNLDHSIIAHGGDAVWASERLGSFLIEIASQSASDAVKFSVLDATDEVTVTDRFDAILDQVPHLIDVSNGIGTVLALQAILAEISESSGGSNGGVTRYLFFFGGDTVPERVRELLGRIMARGPAAGVVVCLWVPELDHDSGFPHALEDLVLAVRDENSATLQRPGEPDDELRLATPISIDQLTTVSDALHATRR